MQTPRPFTRRQRQQNAAFLAALSQTGNARHAARALGVNRSTYTKRRAKHPEFAAEWDKALAAAHATLQILPARSVGRGTMRSMVEGSRAKLAEPCQTLAPARTPAGHLQLRRAPPGRIGREHEKAFLLALASTANVRHSAAAAGFAHSSFYARAAKSRAFAREMQAALAIGYERVESAALIAALPESRADDPWLANDLPPIPPMTASQALQLLCLHEKSVRQSWELPHRRRRRGESSDAFTERLRAMWTAERARAADDQALRQALREEGSSLRRSRGEGDRPKVGGGVAGCNPAAAPTAPAPTADPAQPPILPALEQVTGWSKACPEPGRGADPDKPPHNPNLALFGGWRIGDWKGGKGE